MESKEIRQWKKPSDLDVSFPTSNLQQLHDGGGCGGDVGGQMLIEREGELRRTISSLLLVVSVVRNVLRGRLGILGLLFLRGRIRKTFGH